MRLCGLLLALSLVLADDYDYDSTECAQGKCPNEIQTNDYANPMNSSNSINRFDIPCIVYNTNILSCSWSIDGVPEDAPYFCQVFSTSVNRTLNCISEGSKKFFSQLEEADLEDDILVKVNVSINGYWYMIHKYYSTPEIEKLEPPQNITTLVKSTNIEIQWMQPRSLIFLFNDCFDYELKINDELSTLTDVLKYNITNFEPTTKYTITIRVRQTINCGGSETSPWSDWSQPVEVNPNYGTWELNVCVIAAIAFVLPMILLAILLTCKFQRLFEKVFPSIPNPSKHVQMLLERNDFNQVVPPKKCEEGTEILEVIS